MWLNLGDLPDLLIFTEGDLKKKVYLMQDSISNTLDFLCIYSVQYILKWMVNKYLLAQFLQEIYLLSTPRELLLNFLSAKI